MSILFPIQFDATRSALPVKHCPDGRTVIYCKSLKYKIYAIKPP
jgi:hypothetical protein